MSMSDDLYLRIQESIVDLNEETFTQLTEEAIVMKVDPVEVIQKAYTVGMQKVGDMFECGDYFLPELVKAAEMVRGAITNLEKTIPQDQVIHKGKVIIGTVEGDIHDIGKNLVAIMLSTRGIEVIDIGVDCHVDTFIERALEEDAEIIGASCLLTMTSPEDKKLIERLKERGLRNRFKVLLGGAAIDGEWAKEIGADGFAEDLKEAVDVTLSLLAERERGN